MSERPTAAVGMHLFYLEDAGVLFSESTGELHLLNPTATLVFSLFQEMNDEAAVCAKLAEIGGLDRERSRQIVDDTLRLWRQRRSRDDAAYAANPSPPDYPWQEPRIVAEYCYRILATTFRVHFSGADQAEAAHPTLRHLEIACGTADVVVDVACRTEGIVLYADREAHSTCTSRTQLAPALKALLWTMAVNRHDFFLDIHAGVVGDGARCIMLPAPSGCGKSTITAALVHAGYQYFSDEIALLREGTFDVFPLPLAISVKESGLGALVNEFPDVADLPLHERADGRRVAYLPPPISRLAADDEARPVAAIVFPRYIAGAATSLVSLAKPAALARLLDECMVIRKPLDRDNVAGLVAWMTRTPCYALTYGSTRSAVAALRHILSPTTEDSASPSV